MEFESKNQKTEMALKFFFHIKKVNLYNLSIIIRKT